MEIYENLNTCNVLYNRPSCLDKTYATKNITDNNRLLYKLKLLQLSPAFLRDGVMNISSLQLRAVLTEMSPNFYVFPLH